jgi:hypothetical protein
MTVPVIKCRLSEILAEQIVVERGGIITVESARSCVNLVDRKV